MSITIKDVARLAGVSVGTVSKVINKQGNVREDFRLRVEAIIEKLNYTPSGLARSVKLNRSQIVGLIVPHILNSFYVQVIDMLERELSEQGYTLFLGNSAEDLDTELMYLRNFAEMRIGGLILASTGRIDETRVKNELRIYDHLRIPIVLIVRVLTKLQLDTVALDNYNGAYRATRYLIDQGHRRIAIISSSSHTSASEERINGYITALEEARLPYESDLIHVGGWTLDSGYEATKKLLGSTTRPTGLFMASNIQTLGALRAVKENGIRIPQDISLICFDDTPWSSLMEPPLTVIRPLTRNLCEIATSLLFDRMSGKYDGPPRSHVVPTELVIRGSVGHIESER